MSTPFNNIGASLIPVFNTHASATESQRGAGDAQKTLSDSASAMNAVGEAFVQKTRRNISSASCSASSASAAPRSASSRAARKETRAP